MSKMQMMFWNREGVALMNKSLLGRLLQLSHNSLGAKGAANNQEQSQLKQSTCFQKNPVAQFPCTAWATIM